MKVYYNNLVLLETITFISPGLGDTKIVVDEGEEKINLIFSFEETEDKDQKIKFEHVDDQTLRLRLSNWNNPFGTTLNDLQEIGTHLGRRLFLIFFVKKAGGTGQLREIVVSLYLGEAAPND